MFEFEFLIRKKEPTHTHSDIEFFYVMDGTVMFDIEDKQYLLKNEDFLIVNVDKNHGYTASGEFLGACIHISFTELSRMMKQNMILFWCNTAADNNEACNEVRGILKKIVSEHFHNKGHNAIYLNSLYYELLHVLTNDFLLNKEDKQYSEEAHKFDARKHEIAEYIRLNFDKQICLEDLAEQLFMSYAYLSKYIKKQFSMGFADYVNSVRLNYAVSQLLHSDESVARIALESGFASSAALNRAFKAKYNMTPTDYRKRWASKDSRILNNSEEEKFIQEQLERHFLNTKEEEKKEKSQSEETVILLNQQKRILKKSWNKMINMGAAADLLRSDMQKHVLYLKEELHFEYVRFWDLYDRNMFLDDVNEPPAFNFDNLDRVLDFLVNNGLKPYIELRAKPKIIIKNDNKFLMLRNTDSASDEMEKKVYFIRKLIIHLLNRYGSERVETWYFELWNAEPEQVLKQANMAPEVMSTKKYLKLFQMISEVLRTYLPSIHFGGGGFSLRYGEELFRQMLEEWKQQTYLPDFISIYCYPYTPDSIDMGRNQSRNADILRNSLIRVRQIMEETEFPTQELHVTEWNFSVSSRNVLNDHCMKGAYLVRNMIDSIELADIMGYWVGSDLYANYYDSTTILNGSGGLLSKDGIRKPAYYAFDFMNRTGKYLRKRGEHYIITDNGGGNWRIVCHNLKNLSYQYGLQKEDEIRLKEQNNLFTDMKKYRMHFELPGKKDGKYLLRIHSVNQHHGSVQDEWMAMSTPEELSRDDLEYLSRITTPRMALQSCVADNGKIIFDISMEPNEIVYIHVTYQYS